MRIIKCDRCGKEIRNNEQMSDISFYDSLDYNYDLCHDCHVDLVKYICRTSGCMSDKLREYCVMILGPEYDEKQITIDDIGGIT